MLYQVKQYLEDFVVEEIMLKWVPSWHWDFLYIFFEKRNLTTMEIVDYLTQILHIQRDEIWIAWLKDKAWITRQWLSVSKQTLNRIWWEDKFLQILWNKVQILEKSFNESPLKVASNDWNKFQIRLRVKQEISQEIKNQIEFNVNKICEKWFPNCFGMQRFWKWKKNFYEAKDRLFSLAEQYRKNWKLTNEDLPYHLRFMLQAYASMYFNEYALNRREKWLFMLQWDILVNRYSWIGVETAVYDSWKMMKFDYQKLKKEKSECWFFEPENEWELELFDFDKWLPTWPMLWWNLLLSKEWTKARVRDDQLLQLAEFDENIQNVCKIYSLWWIRRVLFVRVPELHFEWDKDDILLEFSLPTWSYATVLLAFVLEWIDNLTLKDNSLIIPRISSK